jgi:hypothetical protein
VSRIPILVQKFGGTSVSTVRRRQQAVGETGALRDCHPRWVARFGRQGIDVRGYELTERRCTYVIPETAGPRAAALLHDTL